MLFWPLIFTKMVCSRRCWIENQADEAFHEALHLQLDLHGAS